MKTDTIFNAEELRNHETSALAIIRYDGRVLMSISTRHNMLTYPIGKCRRTETPYEGLARELREELGFIIEQWWSSRPGRSISERIREEMTREVIYHRGHDVKVGVHVFVLRLTEEDEPLALSFRNMEPEKCRALVWLKPEEFEEFLKLNDIGCMADCVQWTKTMLTKER